MKISKYIDWLSLESGQVVLEFQVRGDADRRYHVFMHMSQATNSLFFLRERMNVVHSRILEVL